MNAVIEYLKAHVMLIKKLRRAPIGKFHCLEEFVLTHGREFKVAQSLPAGVVPGKARQCYMNCGMIVIRDPRFIYCEGYALGIIPVMHAWLMDKETGECVDPTWTGTDGLPDPGKYYYGVPFKTEYFRYFHLRYQHWGMVDAWESRWPLLKASPKKFLYKNPNKPLDTVSRLT